MSIALGALLGYAGWALLLAFAVVGWRSADVLRSNKRSNEFTSGVPHGGDLYWRLNRAHLNAVENLPIFGAVVVVGALLDVHAIGFHHAAGGVFVARVLQSLVHVSGSSAKVVNVRFTFYLVQLLGILWMVVQILRAALAQ